jgi:hypothetical protein
MYHITDSTNIAKVPLKKLLSHVNTKMELIAYLTEKTQEKAQTCGQCVVVAWGCTCIATYKNMSYLGSNEEEADAQLMLHALDATVSGAAQIAIYLPYTDVLVIALQRYPELCKDASFVTVS